MNITSLRIIFPAALDTLAYTCKRIMTRNVGSLQGVNPWIARTLCSSSNENSGQPGQINPKFINRNPRSLERLGLARKRKGWKYQYPPVEFYHKLTFDLTHRHTMAVVESSDGQVVVSASTKESAISRFLYSSVDVSAARNIGRVLAQRCLESGMEVVMLVPPVGIEKSEKFLAFQRALEEGGIDLEEPGEVVADYEPGINYDDPEKMEELKQRQKKVQSLGAYNHMYKTLHRRRRKVH